jgi:phosphatidate phosphatase APP1
MYTAQKLGNVLLLGLIAAVPSFPQAATVLGRVTDPSGAVLANVHVTATRESTQVSVSSTTNAEGYYALPSLPVGLYTLAVHCRVSTPRKGPVFFSR